MMKHMTACVQERRGLQALLLMDESSSLQTTDPKNERVDAAKAALDSLASLAEHDLRHTICRVCAHGSSHRCSENEVNWRP